MPKIGFASNAKDLRMRLKQVRATIQPSGLRQIEARVVPEALGMLILGLNATVYETLPGKYARTDDLLRGADVVRAGRGTQAGLLVLNTQPYSVAVEYGVLPATPALQARERASAPGISPQPLVTGRSGLTWQKPSLAHTRAQVYGLLRIREEIRAGLLKAWG